MLLSIKIYDIYQGWFYVYTVKKFTEFLYFFLPNLYQKRENPYADKEFFGALQRRNFLSFEEENVFLFLQG